MENTGIFYRKPEIVVANVGLAKKAKQKKKPTNCKLADEIKQSIFCNCKKCSDFAKWKEENPRTVLTDKPDLASFPSLAKGNKTEVIPSPKQLTRKEEKTPTVMKTKTQQKLEKTPTPYGQFETPNRFAPLANLNDNKPAKVAP